jgi:hypothetical protein
VSHASPSDVVLRRAGYAAVERAARLSLKKLVVVSDIIARNRPEKLPESLYDLRSRLKFL